MRLIPSWHDCVIGLRCVRDAKMLYVSWTRCVSGTETCGGADFTAVGCAHGGSFAWAGFADGAMNALSGVTEALGGGARGGFGIPGRSFFDCFGMLPAGFGSSRGAADDEADAGDGVGGVGGDGSLG